MRELVVDLCEVLQRQGQGETNDAAGRVKVELREEGGVDCCFWPWFSKTVVPSWCQIKA